MTTRNLTARAEARIAAPRPEVWKALVTPDAIAEYMFGAQVETDWQVGSPIVWRGEWEGKRYEDKGVILAHDRDQRLRYSHFSPRSGDDDLPENYHTVTVTLADDGDGTRVVLTQDNNLTEQARAHSEKNWSAMLTSLKAYLEA